MLSGEAVLQENAQRDWGELERIGVLGPKGQEREECQQQEQGELFHETVDQRATRNEILKPFFSASVSPSV